MEIMQMNQFEWDLFTEIKISGCELEKFSALILTGKKNPVVSNKLHGCFVFN